MRPAATLVTVRSLPISPIDTVPKGALPAKVCVVPLIISDSVPIAVLAMELLPIATVFSSVAFAPLPIASELVAFATASLPIAYVLSPSTTASSPKTKEFLPVILLRSPPAKLLSLLKSIALVLPNTNVLEEWDAFCTPPAMVFPHL